MRWRLPSRRKCSLVVLVAAVGHDGRRPATSRQSIPTRNFLQTGRWAGRAFRDSVDSVSHCTDQHWRERSRGPLVRDPAHMRTACSERVELPQKFSPHLGSDRHAAFIASAGHAVEPAAAALVAGEFGSAGRIPEDHRQAPMNAKPSASSKSSRPRSSSTQRRLSM